ncbi:MAG: adenine methyltransferase [Armatimonadetes bacterium]|nr:adenine methyltransferase [Armatimonadota bacterium]
MATVYVGNRNDQWRTPRILFERLDEEFGFTIDVAADGESALCKRYICAEHDGLTANWQGEVVWCNPPFSEAALWIEKARREAENGAVVVMLLPVRTGNRSWHEHIFGVCREIRFVKGRLRFEGASHNAPFDCAIVIWGVG